MSETEKNAIVDRMAELLLVLEELETEKRVFTKDINEVMTGILQALKQLTLRIRQGTTQEELAL